MIGADRTLPASAEGASRPLASGSMRLLVAFGLIAAVWLIVLPWLAARPSTAARLDWLEERGIDPSAMFYTELDAMDPILDRLERRR